MTDDEIANLPAETNAEYHADTEHVGHSMLEVFRRSPAEYNGMFVTGEIPLKEPTPAMRMGSGTHILVCEPERWEHDVVCFDGERRTDEKKAEWKRYADAGKVILRTKEIDPVHAMAKAVKAHPIAAKLLAAEGPVETAIRWTDPTGIRCKCKPDKLIPEGIPGFPHTLCVDLKTAADPSPVAFGKSAANFGYHRQAAHYVDGCRDGWDIEGFLEFVWIIVGNTPPHDVWASRCPTPPLMQGAAENITDLGWMVECKRTGQWIAQGQNKLTELQWPAWAGRK